MLDLKQSYLAAFDPHDTGEPFGFMRANISGREQWWLVQVWAEDNPDETVMVRFLEQEGPDKELVDFAENYAGRPWYPIQWISDEIPKRFAPSFRLSLDMPGGKRIIHEWGPEAMGESGRKTIDQMIEKAQREAFMRRRVYPNQVRAGRMSQKDADRRIDLMEAIVTRLTRTAGME